MKQKRLGVLCSALLALWAMGCEAPPPLPPLNSESVDTSRNQIWRVSDLEYHRGAHGGYYTLTYSPSNRSNPQDDSSAGRVDADDLVGQSPASDASGTALIVVKPGGIQPLSPEISTGDDTPMQRERRHKAASTEPGMQT